MKTAIALAGLCCLGLSANGADVTQFRGEGRMGAYPETGLLREWPENGPNRLWTATGIGLGYSSVISVGDTLYITGPTRKARLVRIQSA